MVILTNYKNLGNLNFPRILGLLFFCQFVISRTFGIVLLVSRKEEKRMHHRTADTAEAICPKVLPKKRKMNCKDLSFQVSFRVNHIYL